MPNADYHVEIEQLLSLVRQLKPHHVNFDEKLIMNKERYVFNHLRAPVYYIHMFENQFFTMCIFVLKNGTRMPLHDHPHMTGILKVLYGNLTIKSYSNIRDPEYNAADELPLEIRSHLRKDQVIKKVKFDGEKHLNEKDCCYLTEKTGNFHTLSAMDGPAAFLDILAPPYSESLGRNCSYYKELLKSDESEMVYLSETSSREYWCETAPYLGINLIDES
ncbi:DgyrCDS229 [Dimorphilus gyrociliatus]|uniref:DgyrCDS229 n=1 Tax=Dimorphilus gyrociliatus TaxID=2664684 RepID=A0A7I8V3Y2_9ANNE|nr:DgyrCDS229 [Dimorphilus gyrociliatus]